MGLGSGDLARKKEETSSKELLRPVLLTLGAPSQEIILLKGKWKMQWDVPGGSMLGNPSSGQGCWEVSAPEEHNRGAVLGALKFHPEILGTARPLGHC